MNRRAAVLLEIMLALSLLIAAGIAITATLDRSSAGMTIARDHFVATELARSAMSKIEAGIENMQNLNGPVPVWTEPEDTEGGTVGSKFDDALPSPSGWELEVKTEPSGHEGLVLVIIRAVRKTAGDRESASCTLRQLIRLRTKAEPDSPGGDS